MSPSPLVTVVIPAFNAAAYVGEAIASIQAQTLEDWQLIVVDDGSTDQTTAAATQAAAGDPRIRIIRFEQNQGISTASNAGFDAARGEFIARLDADDLAVPQRLASQVAAFRADDRLAAAGSHASVFGDAVGGIAYCAMGDANIKARLFFGLNTIGGSTIMVRRAFVRQHRIRFNENVTSAEDLDYLTSIMAAGGDLANVDEVLLENRVHATSFTRSRQNVGQQFLQIFRRRILALWYPRLDAEDIERIVAMFFEPYAPQVEHFLATVRAVDRLVLSNPDDYGQDTSVVHALILERLPKMAALYRDHGLLDASHLQAARCFVTPATAGVLDQIGVQSAD